MCPLGAILFTMGMGQSSEYRDLCLGLALAFSAGIFLCISLGDLLPEVHFHSHDRLHLSMMLLLGVILALAIEMLPGHQHPSLFKEKNATDPTAIPVDPATTSLGPPATVGAENDG
jgi:hypothetical protein